MSTHTEALARLRAEAENRFHSVEVEAEDLRALLDAYEESLRALVGALHVLRESDAADVWEEETDAVKDLLLKAGLR